MLTTKCDNLETEREQYYGKACDEKNLVKLSLQEKGSELCVCF
jgi:hypothetical protein